MNGISPALAALDLQVPNKLEWKYEMRREAQEILPGSSSPSLSRRAELTPPPCRTLRRTFPAFMALSHAPNARHYAHSLHRRITRTVRRLLADLATRAPLTPPSTGRHLFSARFPDNFAYLILEVRDADDQNLIRIFPR